MKHPRGMLLSSDDACMRKGEEGTSNVLQSKKEKCELSSLVKSVTMKSKQVRLPPDGNTKKGGKMQFRGVEK